MKDFVSRFVSWPAASEAVEVRFERSCVFGGLLAVTRRIFF